MPKTDDSKIKAAERAAETERERAKALGRKADAVGAEAAKLTRDLVALARDAQLLERRIADLAAKLAAIAKLESGKRDTLKREHARLAKLLASLQRLARNPPEALLAYSDTPQDTLRSAMLLKSVLPQLESRAAALKSELESLARLRADAAKRKASLNEAAKKLARKRQALDGTLARKRTLEQKTRAAHKRAEAAGAELAAKAKSLSSLLRRIEKDRIRRQAKKRAKAAAAKAPPPPNLTPPAKPIAPAAPPRTERPSPGRQLALGPPPSIRKARGRLTRPVVGRMVSRFGRRQSTGNRAKGIRFATAPNAQVVAPHGGYVVFAGPFRGYGRLLIIDHGEGYHSLLAGLGRIDVGVNQRLLAGEPIGIMAPPGKGNPRLYLELRRNGRPVDPLPWLAASPTDKVSG